jgi:hypothetical protein
VTVVNEGGATQISPLEAAPCRQNRELQPIAEFTIALPMQGFMQAFGVLENVRDRFAEQGLISPSSSPDGGAQPPPPSATKSPNFS